MLREHLHEQYATLTELNDQLNRLTQMLSLALNAKADYNHTHAGLWDEEKLREIIDDETKEPWYSKLFKGIEFVNEVAQDGYIYWLQTQITAIWQTLGANGLVDTTQTASITGVGALASGIA